MEWIKFSDTIVAGFEATQEWPLVCVALIRTDSNGVIWSVDGKLWFGAYSLSAAMAKVVLAKPIAASRAVDGGA